MPIRVPRFRPNYRVRTVAGAGTFLLTETLPTVLNGELYERVCPLVDGRRSVDDIVDELRAGTAPAEVYYALDQLERRGFVEEARGAPAPPEAALWHAWGADSQAARRRLHDSPVRVVTLGSVPTAPVLGALGGAGLAVDTDGPVTLVVADDYRRPGIDAVEERARAGGRAWALVKPVGVLPWIGPFFPAGPGPAGPGGVGAGGGEPGCGRCLADRIRMNLVVDAFVEERTGDLAVTAVAAPAAGVQAVLGLAALELARWIVTGESDLVGALVSLSLVSRAQHRHVLTRRPQCPRCGDPARRPDRAAARPPEPVPLHPRRVVSSLDGGHRTAGAAETLERYAHLVSPITGVVSRLESVSPPGHPVIHAWAASHNWAVHPDSLAFLKRTLRSQSGGKGTTEEQARVGALAEALERYSGVFRGDEVRRRARRADLGGDALLPNEVMLFSERQFHDRAVINAEGNSFQMVPEPFDGEAPTDWSPLWAPTSGAFRWLPTGLLYYSYSKSVPTGTLNRLGAYADSNGCGAGATREEAALQGLLELVERDAVATWWYSEVRRPAVDLDDLDDPYLDELRAWLAAEGRELWVLDITNDIGIPAFAAVSPRAGGRNIVVGFGAHLDPRIGVMRAVTEVNQFFASLHALGEDDLHIAFDPGAVDWWRTATLDTKAYLLPAMGAPARRMGDHAPLASDDLLEEVHTTVSRIEARGLEVLLLDQTRPDVGFPVIKAVVPGLRHFWARHGPGRLYDVPVGLGWLPRPRREDQLNPTPVFF